MKRKQKVIVVFIILLINLTNLKADCNIDKETVKDASIELIHYYDEGINVDISVKGLNENFKIDIYDEVTDSSKMYGEEAINDEMFYIQNKYEENKENNYKIDIYSNSCGEEILRTLEIDDPKINIYALMEDCEKGAGKSKLCDLYEDTSNLTKEEFLDKLSKDIKSFDTKHNRLNKINTIIKKYALFVILPIIAVCIFFLIKIYFVKKNNKKKLGKLGVV